MGHPRPSPVAQCHLPSALRRWCSWVASLGLSMVSMGQMFAPTADDTVRLVTAWDDPLRHPGLVGCHGFLDRCDVIPGMRIIPRW